MYFGLDRIRPQFTCFWHFATCDAAEGAEVGGRVFLTSYMITHANQARQRALGMLHAFDRKMELTCPHKQHHNNDENFPRSQLLVLLRHLLHRHLICARGKRDRETQPRGSGCARHWVNSTLGSNRQRVGVRATRRESSPVSHTSYALNSRSISCSAATAPGKLQKGRERSSKTGSMSAYSRGAATG